MKRHGFARGLLVGAIGLLMLLGSTSVASADPRLDPTLPPGNSTAPIPGRTPDLPDMGAPSRHSDGTGMFCENQSLRCR